ncbi:MAG TPA: hypothetical protein VFY40_04270 [Blastocatellia bacterium]|nr:hypothetical protein [Blastocatellia bacterium]
MQEAQIGKFAAHYRLPHSAIAARQRLDQVMLLVLDEMFERALEEAGLPEDGELCLSNIHVSIRLPLTRADASLAAEWGRELAGEILRAMRDRRAVFYRSRRHALIDLVVSVGRGDLSRAWAWRQLGLWRAGNAAGASEAIFELVRSISSDPVAVIPALIALAEAGCLERIARRFTPRHWMTLAAAALSEADGDGLVKEAPDSPSSRAARDAMRMINSSRLLPAITASQSLTVQNPEACRAAAALVALEVEPARLKSESAREVVGLIAAAIRSAITELSPSLPEMPVARQGANRKAVNETPREGARPIAPDMATESPRTTGAPAIKRESGQHLGQNTLEGVDRRRRSLTRFGGLLFLLGMVEELKLALEILAHPELGARPFRWVMIRLALALAPVEENDPAALAFAGLPPDTERSLDHEPPSETETGAINSLAARIVERLGVLIDQSGEWSGDRASLIEFVCHRSAEIVAEPGWIDVRFSLDEVATEIRRAGLDLDPGYTPWLGVVVRFIYE